MPYIVTPVTPLLIFAHCENNCAELALETFGIVCLTICAILFIEAGTR